MKRLAGILIALAAVTLSAVAQTGFKCGTIAGPNTLQGLSGNGVMTNNGPYTIALYIHWVQGDNGTPSPTDYMEEALGIVRDDFSGQNICFVVTGRDTIRNSDYTDNDIMQSGNQSLYNSLTATHTHAHAIDVYVVPSAGSNNNPGKANGTPGTVVVITDEATATHILTHEIAHCLGLYHTFHGTFVDAGENGNDPNVCKELVNGSNGATCGDYVTDTPADPGMFTSYAYYCQSFFNQCNWLNNGTICNYRDANNALYDPDETNFMSYTDCRSSFTSGQGQRMRDMIANTQSLQDRLVESTHYVQNVTISADREEIAKLGLIAGNDVIPGSGDTPGDVSVSTGTNVRFKAGRYISLRTGFSAHVSAGKSFEAQIIPIVCTFDKTRRKQVDEGNDGANPGAGTPYHPFLANTRWLALKPQIDLPLGVYLWYCKINDTLINNITYSKIKIQAYNETVTGFPIDPCNGGGLLGVQFVREDTVARKVYMRYPGDTTETLYYDFTLNLGARMPTDTTYVLTMRDSVPWFDGYRQRFTFTSTKNIPEIWVEGIGGLRHTFTPENSPLSSRMLCVYSNNNVVYDSGGKRGFNCADFLGSASASPAVPAPAGLSLSARLNATQDRVQVEYALPSKGFVRIVLSDQTGRQVMTLTEEQHPPGRYALLHNLGGVPSGLYYITLQALGQTVTQKLTVMR